MYDHDVLVIKNRGRGEERRGVCIIVLERSVWVFRVLHNINPWSPLFSERRNGGTVGMRREKVGF